MAPSRNRKAAVNPLADARAAAKTLAARVRKHNQICSECHTAGADTAKLCDQGWEFAKQIARSNAAIRRLETAPPPAYEQAVLW